MPRAFTDEERSRVRTTLLSAARSEFAQAGYRKANIASIAREAGIGKGTIYLFFSSKAELFVTVLDQVEREMREELRTELQKTFGNPRERLEFFFQALLTRMVDHPLLWIAVDPVEATALFRDLGPEAEHLDDADEAFFRRMVSEWRRAGWLSDVQPEVFGGAARALYAISLHRDLYRDAYPAIVDLLIKALARELVPT